MNMCENYLTKTYSTISGANSYRCIGIVGCLRYNRGNFTRFLGEKTLIIWWRKVGRGHKSLTQSPMWVKIWWAWVKDSKRLKSRRHLLTQSIKFIHMTGLGISNPRMRSCIPRPNLFLVFCRGGWQIGVRILSDSVVEIYAKVVVDI
jgi:hypothetical protein